MVSPYTARGYGIFDEVKAQVQEPRRPVRVRPGEAQGAGRPQQERQTRSRRPASTRTPGCSARSSTCAATRRPRRTATACGRGCTISTSSASTCWNWPPACPTPRRSRRSTRSRRCRRRSASSATRRSTRSPGCSRTTGEFEGVYGSGKGGWFTDMFARRLRGRRPAARRSAGGRCNGSASGRRRTRASPSRWSSTSTTSSPAARCCCRRRTSTTRSTPPSVRAYREQRRADRSDRRRASPKSGFNLKSVFKDWIASDFYRADGLATAANDPKRRAELDDVGLVRMLVAGAGRAEGRRGLRRAVGPAERPDWRCSTAASTRRKSPSGPTDPSGAMGAIQRILANDVACKHVAARLRPPAGRAAAVPRHRAGRAAGRVGGSATRRSARRSSICTSASWAGTTPRTRRRSTARSSSSPAIVAGREGAEGHRQARERTRAGRAAPCR